MNILIAGKKIKNSHWQEIDENHKIGQYYSPDRYYTILNEFIDINLKRETKLVFFIISYLMRSNNYKHESSIANGKSVWVWMVDIFCWICCGIFVLCLFSGFAKPIIDAIKNIDISSFIQELEKSFKNPETIGFIIGAILSSVVSISYIYMVKKVISKNKKLNLQDFVTKKINYVIKISFVFHIKEKFFKTQEDEIVIIEKVDDLNNVNRWLTLQTNNLMYKLFNNFNVALKFENVDENTYEQIKKIIDVDFKNLDVVILGDPKTEDSKEEIAEMENKEENKEKDSKKKTKK